MSKSPESSVIPSQVQQLFAQIYGEILASAQSETTSEQTKQIQGELEMVKAELKGILFAFNESQKQVTILAEENERLKQGGDLTQEQNSNSTTTETPLSEETSKAQQKTSAKKASKPKPVSQKTSKRPTTTKPKSNSTIAEKEGWKVGTKRMQSDLTKTKILTRTQTDKVKKAGVEVIGKDGSVWKFTGRRRERNNAKIYERVS